MGARQWTTEQKQCIDARGGTVLVSAAAGSGKTSVLVQRVIGLVTDSENPVDVDSLLVVTFTKAAAAEMKQRLSAELSRLIAEHPDDIRLQRQQMLLPRANISTIHSFCSALIREYFHLLDISPQFKIAEEAEMALLRDEAVSEVLEEAYTEKEPAFLELADLLSSSRDDRGISKAIRRIYDFIQSHPFPEQWLAEQEKRLESTAPIAETIWGQIVLEQVANTLEYTLLLLDRAYDIASQEERMLGAYGDVLLIDKENLRAALVSLKNLTWDECIKAVNGLSLGRLGALRKYEDEARKERVKTLREEAKKRMKTLPDMFCATEEECWEDMEVIMTMTHCLFQLVRRYSIRLQEKKKKRNVLDFGDLEHASLTLLVEERDGVLFKTPLAKEISLRFSEILVDEYQDTNAAQDALFSALSRDETNLFMVGDVKQSIYGFRQAMPEIFINRRAGSPPYDGVHFPASITLGNNFRSRPEVTDTVNFCFRQLMTQKTGGITYDQREALVPSASFPAGDLGENEAAYQTELMILDTSLLEEGDSKDIAEARCIAMRIREMMLHFPITDKEKQRPARYGDFCILLRSKASHAQAYVDELNRCGIPAWTSSTGGFFSASEVALALSFLRFIDNPLQDVPLLAVLLSPLFGFSPDDLAVIRKPDRSVPLYSAVRHMSLSKDSANISLVHKCRDFLDKMERYRTLATALPADVLIHRIYEDSGMLTVMGAKHNGQQRVANLRLLHDYARRFEQNGYRGLSAFIRYINRLEQQHMDMAPASVVSENADVVRIMSIHNSKGLEFPVVFIAGMGNLFNPDSTKGDMLLHADTGIGLVRREADTLKQYNTVIRQGVALSIQKSERTEELRVLYVAMTRAKEKLVMMISQNTPAAKLSKLAAVLGDKDTLSPYSILSARSMGEWILSLALRHPSGSELRQIAGAEDVSIRPADSKWRIDILRPPAAEADSVTENQMAAIDETLFKQIQERLAFTYTYAPLGQIPSKMAASAVSHQNMKEQFIAMRRPAFLGSSGLTPAERGTALHTFMQFADYTAARKAPEQEIARLVNQQFLTQEQGDCIPIHKVKQFFISRLYERMHASPCCLREYHFTIDVPAAYFADNAAVFNHETVVVQGIADCVFEEDGKLIVVDYKTDKAGSFEELVQRYQEQLRIYAYALERTLRKPVAACMLYSFAFSKEIHVPLL